MDVVAPTSDGWVTFDNGLRLGAGPLPNPGRRHDTLVIAGGPGARAAIDDSEVVEWIAGASRRTRRTEAGPDTAGPASGAALVAPVGPLVASGMAARHIAPVPRSFAPRAMNADGEGIVSVRDADWMAAPASRGTCAAARGAGDAAPDPLGPRSLIFIPVASPAAGLHKPGKEQV